MWKSAKNIVVVHFMHIYPKNQNTKQNLSKKCFFFEIDLANKAEVEMILMDEKERRKFDRHPRSDNIMDWKNYLILDDKALQYIKMIKKDGHVPYIAPCYTKEEYEESISPCRKQK